MARPNVLWVCTDQQRFDTLGRHGHPLLNTPNLTRFAEEGVEFENAFCQSPVCAPSRASLLTGRYARTTRLRQNGQKLPQDERLVTRILADAGYDCGLSGKLHIAPCHPKACPRMEERIEDGYSEIHWSHHPKPEWPDNQYIRWLAASGVSFDTPVSERSRYINVGMPDEHHHTKWCFDTAIEFVERHASVAAPWLFSVNVFAPHHPFDPPPEFLDRYRGRLDEIPLPNFDPAELGRSPQVHRIDHQGAYHTAGSYPYAEMQEEDHRLIRAAYWAMIDQIDRHFGRLLHALETSGQANNTIVIFMSDHGELLGDHGLYLKGPFFYDPCVRVPLVVRWPEGIPGGKVVEGLVELVDLAPTLLDAASLPHEPQIQGQSVLPLLRGDGSSASVGRDVYCEYYEEPVWGLEHDYAASMVRTETHKLVAFHTSDEGLLFDLSSDPDEQRNLWDDPAHLDLKADMLKRLCDRMAGTVDPLPERQAPW